MARQSGSFAAKAALLLLVLHTVASGVHGAEVSDQLSPNDEYPDAITIKLTPGSRRDKAEVRSLVSRLRQLPELAGVPLAAASRELLVLIPTPDTSVEKVKEALLQQPEVYELEVGEALFRREGDHMSYDDLRKEKLATFVSDAKDKAKGKFKEALSKLMAGRAKRDVTSLLGKDSNGAADGKASGHNAGRRKRRIKEHPAESSPHPAAEL